MSILKSCLFKLLLYKLVSLFFVPDLSEIDVNTFLGPFLDVIRSEDTTGPITGVALSSVNKFLSYGLVGMFTDLVCYYHVQLLSRPCTAKWNFEYMFVLSSSRQVNIVGTKGHDYLYVQRMVNQIITC